LDNPLSCVLGMAITAVETVELELIEAATVSPFGSEVLYSAITVIYVLIASNNMNDPCRHPKPEPTSDVGEQGHARNQKLST
jgi:hypothetical protein